MTARAIAGALSALAALAFSASAEAQNGYSSSRPLCPYPQTARVSGTGSTDDPASFVCQMPE